VSVPQKRLFYFSYNYELKIGLDILNKTKLKYKAYNPRQLQKSVTRYVILDHEWSTLISKFYMLYLDDKNKNK
jgi:hypothetical protein